ncbi:hypothetical protein EU527_17005 [Candidatus Thorarchaeota archaeon]|nr:MAG: hypothetical protein EU527_17005 [Candidatus Thorarchaeota archaeon]
MKENELNEIRQLIEIMQSGLVELFEQLRELRERLHIVTGLSSESTPSIIPLFSEIKTIVDKFENDSAIDTKENNSDDAVKLKPQTDSSVKHSSESETEQMPQASSTDELDGDHTDGTTTDAKVSRVLDPIAHELRTGEATADIILEYLQTAKEYLIDDEEHKKKVGRDMDIVLNFLKARGKRAIRTEERDNILKRIRRWKAHLVSYSGSPAK